MRGKALFQSYGRCFAEFLNECSLVRLGLLDLLTCVGLRYGLRALAPSFDGSLEVFLGHPRARIEFARRLSLFSSGPQSAWICQPPDGPGGKRSNPGERSNVENGVTPSKTHTRAGILAGSSIAYAFRPRLRIA